MSAKPNACLQPAICLQGARRTKPNPVVYAVVATQCCRPLPPTLPCRHTSTLPSIHVSGKKGMQSTRLTPASPAINATLRCILSSPPTSLQSNDRLWAHSTKGPSCPVITRGYSCSFNPSKAEKRAQGGEESFSRTFYPSSRVFEGRGVMGTPPPPLTQRQASAFASRAPCYYQSERAPYSAQQGEPHLYANGKRST